MGNREEWPGGDDAAERTHSGRVLKHSSRLEKAIDPERISLHIKLMVTSSNRRGPAAMVRIVRFAVVLGPLAMSVGAAAPAPQSLPVAADGLAPLGEPSAPIQVAAHVQTAMFEPAPVPNPDASGPASAIDPRAGLGPRIFSPKNEFEGDGFSGSSSQAETIDARKQPAAGLGFNVPVISSPR